LVSMLGDLVLCAFELGALYFELCTLYAETKAPQYLTDLKTTNKAQSSKH